MNLKKALIVCMIPVFVISGCGKTTKEEANNTTNQKPLPRYLDRALGRIQRKQRVQERKHRVTMRVRMQKCPGISLLWTPI